jgi:cell filamentation protein
VATRSYELSKEPLKGRFDLAHLQAIHRHLFGDVYERAGQLRNIDIGKGCNRSAHYAHIESAAGSIFRQLAQENQLTGLGADAFSERAASGARKRVLHRVGIRQSGRYARCGNSVFQWRHP